MRSAEDIKKTNDMSNVDYIGGLIDRFSFYNKDKFYAYLDYIDTDINNLSLEEALIYVFAGPCDIVWEEPKLKSCFIDNIISEEEEIKTYLRLDLDEEFLDSTEEEILDYLKENMEDLIFTSTSVDSANNISELSKDVVSIILECTGNLYKKLKDFKLIEDYSVIMYKPKIKIHSIKRE